MFLALRAYLTVAPDVQPLAYHTLYTEVYQAYNALVPSDGRRRN
jgi:hypothetical protein